MRISDWSSDVCSSDLLNYLLAPAGSIGAMIGQVRRALAWFYRHAAELGIDSGRIVVACHHDARSEECTSELQSLMRTSYAVCCWKKNTRENTTYTHKSRFRPSSDATCHTIKQRS